MTCRATCRQPSPSMAHCGVCHRTFGGVTGFDAHRKDGGCVGPYRLGMVEHRGVWRRPMDMDVRERLRPAARPVEGGHVWTPPGDIQQCVNCHQTRAAYFATSARRRCPHVDLAATHSGELSQTSNERR